MINEVWFGLIPLFLRVLRSWLFGFLEIGILFTRVEYR